MFGFLKKTLKKAISKFSKEAEEDITEEKVEDAAAIEAAQREEQEEVEHIPELPAEKEQHEKEKKESAKPKKATPPKSKPPAPKAVEKVEPKVVAEKPAKEHVAAAEEKVIATEERASEKVAEPPAEKTAEEVVATETAQAEEVTHEAPAEEIAEEPEEAATPATPEVIAPVQEVTPTAEEKEEILKEPSVEEQEEKSIEEKPTTEEQPSAEAADEEEGQKKGFFSRIFKRKPQEKAPEVAEKTPEEVPEEKEIAAEPAPTVEEREPEPVAERKEEKVEEPAEEREAEEATPEEAVEEATEQKKGIFTKLKESFTKKTLAPEKFDELFWELEVAMLENNVAVEVVEKIKGDMREELTTGKVSRMGIEEMITQSLKRSLNEVLSIPNYDLVKKVREAKKRPYVISFIGVNGSGKTTTLAKIANLFQNEGLKLVMAASDTFRAAAIDQLKEHADKLNIKLISQGYGADPAAVAYDAIEHAKAKSLDVVMIDTAGRLHSNTNLMAELEKVCRVAAPDLKIFIGESVTGNDCVEQAKEFDKLVGIDAIILSKADVDEKGGAAISVSYVTQKPVLYLGVGQAYGDLKRFDKTQLLASMGF